MRSDCHLGFAITGSFCTFEKIKKQIELLRDEAASITPILAQRSLKFPRIIRAIALHILK